MILVVTVAALFRPEMDRRGLRSAAEQVLREELGAERVFRLCPHCGSDTHGRPVVRMSDGRKPHVSLSYAEGLVLVAWTFAGPVGVDVEADGPAVDEYGDRRTWTRAEAILKATGEGLRRDPATVTGDEAWTTELELGDGWVGAVAVQGIESARLRQVAGPAAAPG